MRTGVVIRRRAALAAAGLCLPMLAAIYQLSAVQLAQQANAAPSWRGWIHGLAQTRWGPILLLAEAASFVLWMLVLGELPLSVAFPLTALGSVLSMGMAIVVLGQPVPPLAWIGVGAILAGAWLIVRPR